MKTHPLRSVDCQLLYETYAPLDSDAVQTLIRKTIGHFGLDPVACRLMVTSTEADIYMLFGDMQIMVTQSLPLTQKTHLTGSTSDLMTQNVFSDAPEVIEQCHAVTSISVRKFGMGGVDLPENIAKVMGPDFEAFCDSKKTRFAMDLTKMLAAQIGLKTPCKGVFWGPNSYLLPVKTFCNFATDDNPTTLFIRSHFYSPIQSVSDKRAIGVAAAGSEYLIGYQLQFDPCTLPPEYMVSNLLAFVGFCYQREEVFPDGDVFGMTADEKIRITYEKTDEDFPDRIVLCVQSSAELGISGGDRPTIQNQYDESGEIQSSKISDVDVSDLDPDDPVDAAILQRLYEVKKSSPQNPDSASASEPEQKHHDKTAVQSSDETAWRDDVRETGLTGTPRKREPPSSRPSMSELREFARQAQVAGEPERFQKTSFLQKFLGKFQKS
ncbi:hypothetical protein [uncultured Roseibium sp.]|uniref:hypothetical protein n=1 Tax=uncultured Roseibium sp. TaxID=1936171 RepID=UPI00260D95FD|nr:hypothetical protein [uncultured Roseibium sp.]